MLTVPQGASSKAVGPHGIWTFSLPMVARCHLYGAPSPVPLPIPAQHCPYSD